MYCKWCNKSFDLTTSTHPMANQLCSSCCSAWDKLYPTPPPCDHKFENPRVEGKYRISTCKCGCEYYKEIISNFEWIKRMTLDEMIASNILRHGLYYGNVPAYQWDDFDHTYYGDDKLGCRQWLEQEYKSE